VGLFLHNALIRQIRLSWVALGGLFYKKVLCKYSFGLFIFWRKRNGGGGWSEAAFCSLNSNFLSERNETGKVLQVQDYKKCDKK